MFDSSFLNTMNPDLKSWTRPGRIRHFSGPGGLPFFELTSPGGRAEVSPHAAHVTTYQSSGLPPLLFLSPRARFEKGQPIRGGIPVIFPWFGAHPSRASNPAHGFARTSSWEVIEADHDDHISWMTFGLSDSAATRALWPHAFQLRYQVRAGHSLELRLEVRNTGDSPFRFEEALHTYFAVQDLCEARVTGLQHCEYLDKPSGFERKRQERPEILFDSEVDRVYLGAPPQSRIEEVGEGRCVKIQMQGGRTLVVWNPGRERAASLSDLGEEAWKSFVCVETGNAAENAIVLAPGASHTLETVLGSQLARAC